MTPISEQPRKGPPNAIERSVSTLDMAMAADALEMANVD
jgi:hypothetical protein